MYETLVSYNLGCENYLNKDRHFIMNFFGVELIKLEGFKFESGFGYSKHVTLKLDKKKYFPVLASQVINWGVKEPWKLIPGQVKCKIIDKEQFLYFSALTKDICCPSKICGFTARDAFAVGIGMMPRMEVALVVVTTEITMGIFNETLAHQVLASTILLVIIRGLEYI